MAMPTNSSDAPAEMTPSPLYTRLGFQIVVGIVLGLVLGFVSPHLAVQMRILGDIFLRLIKLIVAPLVFLNVVLGIASAGNLKNVGRIGLRALVYFEVVSTIALAVSMGIANLSHVGTGMHLTQSPAAAAAAHAIFGEAGHTSFEQFLLALVPDNFLGAFTGGSLLQVLVISIGFGAAVLMLTVEQRASVEFALARMSDCFFKFVDVIMKFAPLGAFGSIAFAIGSSGMNAVKSLGYLLLVMYLALAFVVVVVLGIILRLYGFNVFRFLRYFKEEIYLLFATASSESALPRLFEKLELLGCSRQSVGLILPTGYAFNLDGTAVYMSLCVMFLANAYGISLNLHQQLGLVLLMLLTSKGAATVSGGTFIVFAATVTSSGMLPIEGLPILFGINRFTSQAVCICNAMGNGVATLVISRSPVSLTKTPRARNTDESSDRARARSSDLHRRRMRITAVKEISVPLEGNVANALVSFAEHDVSLVALETDVMRDGKPVTGFAFDSIGRYAQGGILRDRMIPRLKAAKAQDLLDSSGDSFDAAKILQTIIRNEKPGGHGDRAAAAAAIELAVWDLNAKLAGEPAHVTIARHFGRKGRGDGVNVYAAGGYYYPDESVGRLADEFRAYRELGFDAFKMKIGGAELSKDLARIEAALTVAGEGQRLAVDANGRFDLPTAVAYAESIAPYDLRWYEEIGDPLDFDLNRRIAETYAGRIATGENLFSVPDVKNLVHFGGMRRGKDIFQMDAGLSYGLTEYAKMIDLIEGHGFNRAQAFPHGGHLINLHIAVGLELGGCEAYPGVFQPFGGYPPGCGVGNGLVRPTDAPGFGLEEKDALRPWLARLINQ